MSDIQIQIGNFEMDDQRLEDLKKEEDKIILIQNYMRYVLCRKNYKYLNKIWEKKINVAKELLETERIYVWNLKLLISSYLKPIKKIPVKILTKELSLELTGLYQILEVISSYHHSFLTALQEKIINGTIKPDTQLGDAFLEMSSYLKSYKQYVNHYQKVVPVLAKRKNDPKLQEVLNNMNNVATRGKGMKDFLIMPVQRIPRYNMLLSDLVKNTPSDHPDYDALCIAKEQILIIAKDVEETSDDSEKLQRLMTLASEIILPKKSHLTIVAPHRRFEWEKDLVISSSKEEKLRHIFACNDMLLITKQTKVSKEIKYKYVCCVDYVSDVKKVEEVVGNNAVILHTGTSLKVFKILAETEQDKNDILELFKNEEENESNNNNLSSSVVTRNRNLSLSLSHSQSSTRIRVGSIPAVPLFRLNEQKAENESNIDQLSLSPRKKKKDRNKSISFLSTNQNSAPSQVIQSARRGSPPTSPKIVHKKKK
eukprot:TRINITY_DN2582_c0_g1_i1.p1 TRINITY_DN2582_c0_g1~~TRINITY_DN2582_c0_g1_i1.p1  ORF type:complete len:501 (+),score=122.08 TRINITY_DN2582_c0_g1_i1:60-1505(+)